jgi:hypothetical protein
VVVVVVVVGLILGFASFASSIDQAGQKSKLKRTFGFGYFKCHPPMESDCQCNGGGVGGHLTIFQLAFPLTFCSL